MPRPKKTVKLKPPEPVTHTTALDNPVLFEHASYAFRYTPFREKKKNRTRSTTGVDLLVEWDRGILSPERRVPRARPFMSLFGAENDGG